MISAEVSRTRQRSGWPVSRTLAALVVSPASFYRHTRRLASVESAPIRGALSLYQATAEERPAAVDFARTRPDLGHRALAWTLVDEDVAYLSASSVYRILRMRGSSSAGSRRGAATASSHDDLLDPTSSGRRTCVMCRSAGRLSTYWSSRMSSAAL